MNNLNYIKLFFTLMLSITFALMISGTFFKYWFAYEASQLMERAAIELSKAQAERDHERIIQKRITEQKSQKQREQQNKLNIQNAKKQQLRKAEREREIRANKAKAETCVFWQKQYVKYKGSYEKTMMNSACK